MTDEDFIIHLFCRVDDDMPKIVKHAQAHLYPSELVTIGLLFALKGVGCRAFYRWLNRNFRPLFPRLSERTYLFRALKTHRGWTRQAPSLLGLADSFGIELLHPRREGRSQQQIGRKGYSNHRWIVGGELCVLLNHLGLVVGWDCDTANVYDGSAFQDLVGSVADQMVVFVDPHIVKQGWSPAHLKVCKRGEWNSWMLIETFLSMLTLVASNTFPNESGTILKCAWHSPWPCSTCWFSGRVLILTRTVSFIFRSPSLVYELAPLVNMLLT